MIALVAALLALSPTTSRADAQAHVLAAVEAHAVTGIDAELLLAIAYVESRYTSRAYAHRRGSHLCGPLQIATRSRATCDALRADVGLSYMTAAQHLATWASS